MQTTKGIAISLSRWDLSFQLPFSGIRKESLLQGKRILKIEDLEMRWERFSSSSSVKTLTRPFHGHNELLSFIEESIL
jgi:hypothetical protein